MASKKTRRRSPERLVVRNTSKDVNDCHHIPELDSWLGVRSIIKTTKGTYKGRLVYSGGWYYCICPEKLIEGEWVNTSSRFLFRKGQFQSITKTPIEGSNGR